MTPGTLYLIPVPLGPVAPQSCLPPDVLAVWWAHKAHLGAYLADMDVVMGGPFDLALSQAADLEDVELAA